MAAATALARPVRAHTHSSVVRNRTAAEAPPEGWDAPWWKLLPKRWGHVAHSMCSYMGMFPPALPRYFIEQFTEPGDVVLDPFSGRGTTALEACISGRIGVGVDLNPLASLLTGAKVDTPTLEEALARVDELEQQYDRSKVTERAPPEISILYDGRKTLPQLLYLRSKLDSANRVDRYLIAAIVGILHGNHPRDPKNARCLSISMPNTFSMSPGYLKRYIRENKLKKYPFDTFEKLRSRLRHLHEHGVPATRGRAAQGDVRNLSKQLEPGSVKLIVTSPPYLNVVRYGKFNWIRLWFLKESVENVDNTLKGHTDLSLQVERTDRQLGLSDRLNFRRYCEFLKQALTECATVLRDDGVCVVTIGDVQNNEHDRKLANDVWEAIKDEVPLTLQHNIADAIDQTIKVSRIWGETKGRATKVDRVLVLSKKQMPTPRHPQPSTLIKALLDEANAQKNKAIEDADSDEMAG